MLRTSRLMILVLSAFSSNAFAGAGLAERQKQISAIQDYQDNFTLVRDRFFLGSDGLTALVGPWTEDCTAWLSKWQTIWNHVQALPQARDFGLARKQVEDEIAEQNQQLARLKSRVTEFTGRADSVIAILIAKPAPYYTNELFDTRVKELVDNNGKLSDHIREIQNKLIVKAARLDAVAKGARDKLDAYVTAQSVSASSPLKDKFAELKAVLAVGKVVDPYAQKLFDIRELVGADLMEGRVFHAERRLVDSQKTLDQAINDLRLMTGVSASIKSERQQYLTNIRNETYTNFTELSGRPEKRYEKTIAFANYNREIARMLCSAGDREINCSLAEWLNRIPDKVVETFPATKLKALEFAWQGVLMGTSAESLTDLKSLQEGK